MRRFLQGIVLGWLAGRGVMLAEWMRLRRLERTLGARNAITLHHLDAMMKAADQVWNCGQHVDGPLGDAIRGLERVHIDAVIWRHPKP